MTLRDKVIARLIKNGNNENEVLEMVNVHFENVASRNNNAVEIAKIIRKIY